LPPRAGPMVRITYARSGLGIPAILDQLNREVLRPQAFREAGSNVQAKKVFNALNTEKAYLHGLKRERHPDMTAVAGKLFFPFNIIAHQDCPIGS